MLGVIELSILILSVAAPSIKKSFFFQKILYEYQGIEAKESTVKMKFVILLQTSILLAELLCYIFLNAYIYTHNSEMYKTSVITQDTYRFRQRSHVFSITHQGPVL
jgi:hypothetical protein